MRVEYYLYWTNLPVLVGGRILTILDKSFSTEGQILPVLDKPASAGGARILPILDKSFSAEGQNTTCIGRTCQCWWGPECYLYWTSLSVLRGRILPVLDKPASAGARILPVLDKSTCANSRNTTCIRQTATGAI